MSDATADLTAEECIPDVPDVSSELRRLASKYGKIPTIDFFPPDFNIDISNFFSFDMFGKILGKGPGGLDFDICAVTIEGDIDGALAGGPVYPESMGSQLESIDEGISGLQDQVNDLGDSSP